MVNFKNIAILATAFFGSGLAAPGTPKAGTPIEGRYIVTLKSGVQTKDFESHLTWVEDVHKRSIEKRGSNLQGVQRKFNGSYGFKGYSGEFDQATVDELKENPDVEAVEQDKIWVLDYIHEEGQSENLAKKVLTTQTGATWGISSVSHRNPGANTYIYDTEAGTNTFAYVVDSGVRTTHAEFEGRATSVYNPSGSSSDADTLGHGTHVAGTIAGKTYGVAKKANVLAIKVFQGSSAATSIILDGYNWSVNDIIAKGRQARSAINLSLGGSFSTAFNTAVNNAASNGVLSVIAAGNSGANAANTSPASAASAVTVGWVDQNWRISVNSNWGPVLDIFGPGSGITSSWYTSDTATNAISGTSMATPHIVGLSLYTISVNGVTGVSAVTNWLKTTATSGTLLGDLRGSPNLLGNNGNSQQ